VIKYNLARFKEQATAKHGDAYDYSAVEEAHVKNRRSKVPIRCKACGYQWRVMIQNHIAEESGCPKCTGHERWDETRLRRELLAVHGDKYNSTLDQGQLASDTLLHLECKDCRAQWDTSVRDLIYIKKGCPKCAYVSFKMTFDDWKKKAGKLNGGKYEYGRHSGGFTATTKVEAKCLRCGQQCRIRAHEGVQQPFDCPGCDIYSSDDQ
jgi:Zn finger protein HypA/HybF involved in hydrogenase expression